MRPISTDLSLCALSFSSLSTRRRTSPLATCAVGTAAIHGRDLFCGNAGSALVLCSLQVPLLYFGCNRYAVFIDNDVMVPEGWLEGLYDLMEATQSWAVLPTYLEGGWCGCVRCCLTCAAAEVLRASMLRRDEALDVLDEGSTTIHMAGGHCYAEPSSTRLGEVSCCCAARRVLTPRIAQSPHPQRGSAGSLARPNLDIRRRIRGIAIPIRRAQAAQRVFRTSNWLSGVAATRQHLGALVRTAKPSLVGTVVKDSPCVALRCREYTSMASTFGVRLAIQEPWSSPK